MRMFGRETISVQLNLAVHSRAVGQRLYLMWLRFRRQALVMLGLSTVATIAAGAWWETDQFNISDSERGAYDDGLKKFTGNTKLFAQLVGMGRVNKSQDIVIIGIDDRSFADIDANDGWRTQYGSFPYDRKIWADVISYLDDMGAKAVIFDSVMDTRHSDATGDMALGEVIGQRNVPVYLGFATSPGAAPLGAVEAPEVRLPQKKAAKPANDAATVDAGEESFDFPEEPSAEELAKAKEAELVARRTRAAKAFSFPIRYEGGLSAAAIPAAPGGDTEEIAQYPIPSIPEVLDVAAGFGLVTLEADEDGKLRRTSFAYTDGQNTYATLPLAVAADAFGAKEVVIAPNRLTLGDHVVPINPDGSAEIDYGGRLYDRFETRSLVDVLRFRAGAPGGDLFKGKYVFIAGLAVGAGDVKATPLDQLTPAVVKQASTLQNLLDGRFIVTAPTWVSYVFAFFVAFFSTALVLVIRNTFVDIGWPVLLYVGFFLITGSFLVATKVHVLSALPGLAGTIGSVLASTWERLFAREERDRLKQMFASYMESDLVDLMVEQRELPSIDGKNMVITAFFSDIKGFSTFSEQYRNDPHGLMRLLNKYLSTVTPVLTNLGACIDKYIGDAVVALFGAPIEYADHPLRACKGALAVQEAIGRLREDFRKQGLPDVYTRIGLNTDQMLVGNIGSEQLIDYTAIGDGMNLAARLEGANKEFGTLIMMGPGTYEAVKTDVEARELDFVRVAGKTQAVAVYELLSLKGGLSKEKATVVAWYADALRLYRSRKFIEALGVLEKALQVDPADGPSQRLHARCRELSEQPPGPQWEPVSELSK